MKEDIKKGFEVTVGVILGAAVMRTIGEFGVKLLTPKMKSHDETEEEKESEQGSFFLSLVLNEVQYLKEKENNYGNQTS